MDRRAILDRLKVEAPDLRQRFGVERLAVFGSVARGDDRAESDLDVLVTFFGRPDFGRFMSLKLHLEDTFGRRVDLLTPNALRPEMRRDVEREAVYVA